MLRYTCAVNRPLSAAVLCCALSVVLNAQSITSRARFLVTTPDATRALTKDSIAVQIDGAPAEVSEVDSAESKPIAFVVLMDVSGSSKDKAAFETQASLELFTRLLSLNHFGFFGDFNDELYLDRKTSSVKAAQEEIKAIQFRGGSAIYDAILQSAKFLVKEVEQRPELQQCRKTIFVISDGEDRASTNKLANVVQELRKLGITVHAIGLIGDPASRKMGRFISLSSETGGTSVLLSNPQEFIHQLLTTVQRQYWVSVTSQVQASRKLHVLGVSSSESKVRLLAPTAVMLE
jgi:hypothetical protein